MHHGTDTNAAIWHHEDDDVDLLYHCNTFVSLFSVSGFPSFIEHVFQRTALNNCFQIWHMWFGKQYLGI